MDVSKELVDDQVQDEIKLETSPSQINLNFNLIKKISVAQLVLGFLSIALGITLEVFAAITQCDSSIMNCFPCTVIGPGIWCGLVIVVAGKFGIIVTKRKSPFYIIAFTAVNSSCAILALGEVSLAVRGAITDRMVIHFSRDEWGRHLPTHMTITNSVLAVAALLSAILFFVAACHSWQYTCCPTNPAYLDSNFYQPMINIGPTFPADMRPFVFPAREVYMAPQGYNGNTDFQSSGDIPSMQPLILVPSNQIPPYYQSMPQFQAWQGPTVGLSQSVATSTQP
ncbi:uncharacterized protein LOC143462311 [Clavelina lepadiformis]|uniref:uncharacterized protein LOC143462311 n=1 Tax=Clavelina lepadiformis TaxID=159417 RepID=UPI00404317C5